MKIFLLSVSTAALVAASTAGAVGQKQRPLKFRHSCATKAERSHVVRFRASDGVRLIGVDTPETVHPQKPVEYFGKEASAFTRSLAEGQLVRLEADPTNADRDRYGRLLRYVYLEDGTLLNAVIIAQGYGFAYVKYPFERMEEFRQLEREAREKGRGLWGE